VREFRRLRGHSAARYCSGKRQLRAGCLPGMQSALPRLSLNYARALNSRPRDRHGTTLAPERRPSRQRRRTARTTPPEDVSNNFLRKGTEMTQGSWSTPLGRTLRGAGIALTVGVLLAAGGWVFAQDKPAAPPAPAAPAAAPAPPPPSKPDPTGTATGGIADVTAKTAGKPTLEEVAEFAGHNRVAVNMMWTLLTGFLVMFMQAGFALAESGFCRAKNVGHTMMMNFMVYAIGMTGYWIMG